MADVEKRVEISRINFNRCTSSETTEEIEMEFTLCFWGGDWGNLCWRRSVFLLAFYNF